jgi:hypothetical protein
LAVPAFSFATNCTGVAESDAAKSDEIARRDAKIPIFHDLVIERKRWGRIQEE